VINDDDNDGQSAKKIEARLAGAMREAGIDRSLGLMGHH